MASATGRDLAPAWRLRGWHRRAGAAAAAFLVFLLITGLPLQFSDALGLAEHHVTATAILDWYGLEAPTDVRASQGLVSVGDTVFLPDSAGAAITLAGFVGAVRLSEPALIVAAGRHDVVLLQPGGAAIVDRFAMEAPIRRIGRYQGRVALDTESGVLLADPALVNWKPASVAADAVTWSQAAPAADPERYRQRFRQRMLTWQRLLEDAHSGRLFGTAGVVVVDAAAVLLAFLSISGLVMWWRIALRRPAGRR